MSVFVLLSQNRQVEKDRIRSDIEYDVNLKAELEIAHLHEKVDNFHEEVMRRLSNLEKASGHSSRPGSNGNGAALGTVDSNGPQTGQSA